MVLPDLSTGTCFEGERNNKGLAESSEEVAFSVLADILTNGALTADLDSRGASLSSCAKAATAPKIEPVRALVGDLDRSGCANA
jgi:hypothetical protein